MTPQQLCHVYPWLDMMLADTLLKLDERGTLEERLKDYEAPPMEEPQSFVGITVENSGEKSLAPVLTVTEDEGSTLEDDVDRFVAQHDG
jgi:hypothetical protein